jgi:pimeloyl-ACP methyl ester carboxylesterase
MRYANIRRVSLRACLCVCLAVLCGQFLGGAAAQQPPRKEKEPPPAEEHVITTKDGVELHATWYPSTSGRNAAVVLFLHDFGGSRTDWRNLPADLQRSLDFAIVTLDLRGHGDSTQQVDPDGKERKLTAARLRPDDFVAMASQDVEAVKRWLIERNNNGELNIERLGIVGAGLGALVAAEWAQQDWAYDKLPSIKQGRDVKALALISPELHAKGLRASVLAEPPIRGQIGLQIIAGSGNGKAVRSARQVYNVVRRHYLDPPDSAPPEEVLAKKKLFLDIDYPTSLQGTKMLGERLGLEDRIARFLQIQLVDREYPWQVRKSPL